MSGHSKWAGIKRKKAVTDSRRGQLFTRLLKEITVSTRIGGGDSAGNPRLRVAIQDARSSNVPNDNIDRAIKRGTGDLEGVSYEELTYEGYGPGGVAVLIETVTDNKTRTVAEIRPIFSRHGGSLGENGCVAWMFTKRGLIAIDRQAVEEDRLMEIAIELEIDDVEVADDAYELFTSPETFASVREALEAREIPIAAQEIAMVPQSQIKLEEDRAARMIRLMEELEEQDDVQHVWANFDIEAEVMAAHVG